METNKLKVDIDNARVERIMIIPKEDKDPRVEVYLALYVGDKRITCISMDSQHWDDNFKFNIPIECYGLIGALEDKLGKTTSKAYQASLKLLKEVSDE